MLSTNNFNSEPIDPLTNHILVLKTSANNEKKLAKYKLMPQFSASLIRSLPMDDLWCQSTSADCTVTTYYRHLLILVRKLLIAVKCSLAQCTTAAELSDSVAHDVVHKT